MTLSHRMIEVFKYQQGLNSVSCGFDFLHTFTRHTSKMHVRLPTKPEKCSDLRLPILTE